MHVQVFRPETRKKLDYDTIVAAPFLDRGTREIVQDIAAKLGELHGEPISENDSTPETYSRSILEILINPELTFPTLSHFPETHPLFGQCEKKYRFVGDMMKIADAQMRCGAYRPVRKLHGDFWYSNILFDEE